MFNYLGSRHPLVKNSCLQQFSHDDEDDYGDDDVYDNDFYDDDNTGGRRHCRHTKLIIYNDDGDHLNDYDDGEYT